MNGIIEDIEEGIEEKFEEQAKKTATDKLKAALPIVLVIGAGILLAKTTQVRNARA